ncbi:MAG: hypothetical protein Kow00133_16470 [Amphiplicatus sp.]
MNKLLGAVAGLAAFAFASVASAASVVVSNDPLNLGGTVGVEFDIANNENGAVSANGVINLGPLVTWVIANPINLVTDNGALPRVENLVMSFYADAGLTVLVDSFALTDAAGVQILSTFAVNLAGLTAVWVAFSGNSVLTAGGTAANVNVDLSAIPVPAALPLLLSGLAGLGFAARRRKAA